MLDALGWASRFRAGHEGSSPTKDHAPLGPRGRGGEYGARAMTPSAAAVAMMLLLDATRASAGSELSHDDRIL